MKLSFDGVLEFVTVAEANGFSEAGRRLSCSTSHVSRQVNRLEERLGCALFSRSTRSVKLTEAGQQYFVQCRELLNGLQQANEQVSDARFDLKGTLRVSMAGSFAEQYVTPALIEFAKLHPNLILDLNFNSRPVNFIEEGIDFSIRYGELSDSGLVARKLIDRSLIAVASPSYLEARGRPGHPNDLKRHNCLVSNNDHWLFEEKGKPFRVKVTGRWKSNNASAIVQACEAGLGIAYMPKSSFADSIARDDLEPVLTEYWTHRLTSWIVYQNRKYLPLKARLAIDHLIDHFTHWKE